MTQERCVRFLGPFDEMLQYREAKGAKKHAKNAIIITSFGFTYLVFIILPFHSVQTLSEALFPLFPWLLKPSWVIE